MELKIMLVDDDDIINMIHKDILGHAGISSKIIVSKSVDEAITYLTSTNGEMVDLIFLDINMPVKTGWDFLNEFEKLEYSEDRPMVMMLTSSIYPGDRERALKYPVVKKFLTKPFSVKILQDIHRNHFEKSE